MEYLFSGFQYPSRQVDSLVHVRDQQFAETHTYNTLGLNTFVSVS